MKSLKSQKGVLAFDFLFGFMLITSFFMLIVILSFTLSAVEVLQYIAFATSRSYVASDIRKGEQEKAAEKKYEQLINGGIFKVRPEWFKLPDKDELNFDESIDDRGEGTHIDFTAKILSFKLPFFLGETGNAEKFQSSVNSYIGREPSMKECQDFVEARDDMIMGRDDMYRAYQINDVAIWDNGC